jgi:hypothetical protein
MADGGELRAFFKGTQEEAAQAVESAAGKMADFGDETAQNVRDSVNILGNAEDANTDAINRIQGNAGDPPAGGAGAGGGADSGSGGSSRIGKLLNGGDGGSVPQEPRLTPGTPEYDDYISELAKDPAKNGKITGASLREAEVGAQAEAAGDIPGPLTRAQFDEDGKDVGEFTDSAGQNWDVKSSPDVQPRYTKNPGQPIANPQPDARFTKMINKELDQGVNVLLDPHGMTPERLAHLQELHTGRGMICSAGVLFAGQRFGGVSPRRVRSSGSRRSVVRQQTRRSVRRSHRGQG